MHILIGLVVIIAATGICHWAFDALGLRHVPPGLIFQKTSPRKTLIESIVILIVAFSISLIVMAFFAARNARKAREECIRAAICPACGYDLSATEQAAGFTACPECGSRWASTSSQP